MNSQAIQETALFVPVVTDTRTLSLLGLDDLVDTVWRRQSRPLTIVGNPDTTVSLDPVRQGSYMSASGVVERVVILYWLHRTQHVFSFDDHRDFVASTSG